MTSLLFICEPPDWPRTELACTCVLQQTAPLPKYLTCFLQGAAHGNCQLRYITSVGGSGISPRHSTVANCKPLQTLQRLSNCRLNSTMALRFPTRQLPRALPLGSLYQPFATSQRRCLATTAPPITQNATGSKGPTAMVFLNMGGPSTTAEVGDFLSRLFVSIV